MSEFSSRTHRRLSILPEVNEDLDVSPVQEKTDRFGETCRTNTDQSSASLDSLLGRQSDRRKPRQYSDSFMIFNNNGRSRVTRATVNINCFRLQHISRARGMASFHITKASITSLPEYFIFPIFLLLHWRRRQVRVFPGPVPHSRPSVFRQPQLSLLSIRLTAKLRRLLLLDLLHAGPLASPLPAGLVLQLQVQPHPGLSCRPGGERGPLHHQVQELQTREGEWRQG